MAEDEPDGILDSAVQKVQEAPLPGEGIRRAVKTSMEDERLKTELITNVSHDLKTPLTSIISYVDLLNHDSVHSHHGQQEQESVYPPVPQLIYRCHPCQVGKKS